MVQITLKHFELSEFDSPDIPGSGERMNLGTLLKLDKMREIVGEAIDPSSGWRSKARNKKVGGEKNSAHLFGFAADLKCISVEFMLKLLEAAWKVGFRRFGIMNGAIHVDDDPTKVPNVMWDYGNEHTARFQAAIKWFHEKVKAQN